jgi:transcription termination/antitermination protein NusG
VRTDELNETDLTHASDEATPEEAPNEEMTSSEATEGPVQSEPADVEPQAEAEQEPAASDVADVEVAEPEPEAEAVEPEAEVAEPEPEPEADAVEPEPEPEAEVAEPEPEPEADAVEPEPEAEVAEPEPEVAEPEPEADVVEPEAEVAAAEPEATNEPAQTTAAAPIEDDPYRGHGDWYVVHTYSGYENKVKANLESRIKTMQMEGKIFGVHIPMEDVMEIKSGKKQVVKKKQFPGYLLVRMIYDNDSWYVVRNTPGVTGFVSAGTGTKPTPLSKHEVEKILAVKKEEVRPQVRLGFEEGDVVRITSGPFADFNGTINEINPDQAKLKVLVNIFDRETPVELSFDQVSKV